MSDRNVDRLSPDAQRLSARLVETKREIKRLEAEEDSLQAQLMKEAKGAGLHEGNDAGFTFAGLNMVVPADSIDNKITDVLRRKKMWHCMSYKAKAKQVEEAIETGRLTEGEVAPFRKSREPYFSLAAVKKGT